MKKAIPLFLAIPLIASTVGVSHSYAEEVPEQTSTQEVDVEYTVYEPELNQDTNVIVGETSYFKVDDTGVVETSPFLKTYTPNKTPGPDMVPVSDGASFTWDYVETTYGSNVISNTASSWLVRAVGWGGAGKLIFTAFKGPVLRTIAGGAANTAVVKASSYTGRNLWWKVVKYTDYDSKNSYVKYAISIYKDSSKKSLVASYTEVHKGAR